MHNYTHTKTITTTTTTNKWRTKQFLTAHWQMPIQIQEEAALLANTGPTWCHMVWSIPVVSLGQLSWICSPTAPCASPALLAGRTVQEAKKTEMSSALCSTAQQQLTHQCYISIIFNLKQKHSIIPTTIKKINSFPDGIRTFVMVIPVMESRTSLQFTYCDRGHSGSCLFGRGKWDYRIIFYCIFICSIFSIIWLLAFFILLYLLWRRFLSEAAFFEGKNPFLSPPSFLPSRYEFFRGFTLSKVNNPLTFFMLIYCMASIKTVSKFCFHGIDFLYTDIFLQKSVSDRLLQLNCQSNFKG